MNNLTGRKTGSQPDGSPRSGTHLQRWLDANGFTAADLEKATKMLRESVARLRRGDGVRLSTMLRVLAGARTLARRKVTMDELFPLDPDDPTS